jgi:lipoate-protein ligase A
VVRRPTGGKAILHTDELTYSLIYPQNHPLVAGDILSSYRRLSQALLGMLAKLGLGAELAPPPSQDMGPAGPVCFEVPSAYEITAGGRKLIGSAQVRRQKAVLQHGSLPLSGDLGRICEVLVFPDEAARQKARQDVLNRATTLEKALGARVSWEQAAQALVEAYQDSFGEALHHGELSPPEAARAEGLRAEVYSQMSWTQKR